MAGGVGGCSWAFHRHHEVLYGKHISGEDSCPRWIFSVFPLRSVQHSRRSLGGTSRNVAGFWRFAVDFVTTGKYCRASTNTGSFPPFLAP